MSNTQKAPGKYFRKGISLVGLISKFPTDEAAEQWFVQTRWNGHVHCPKCGSLNVGKQGKRKGRTLTEWRCREHECRKYFTVKTDTILHDSKLGLQKWLIALYLFATNLKGVSSMKLYRDLGITQKHAWHLGHRIRKAMARKTDPFVGTNEADEAFIGGKERNKHKNKKTNPGGGSKGKTAIIAAKNRETNKINATVIPNTKKPTIHKFIEDTVADGSSVYTDELKSYLNMKNINHERVRHKAGEYVRYKDLEEIHTNGVESFWAMFKRGFYGTYHLMTTKHLDRYVKEFVGRHNTRSMDTLDQMADMMRGTIGKRLDYAELVAG